MMAATTTRDFCVNSIGRLTSDIRHPCRIAPNHTDKPDMHCSECKSEDVSELECTYCEGTGVDPYSLDDEGR